LLSVFEFLDKFRSLSLAT